jgi:hypothetical protein
VYNLCLSIGVDNLQELSKRLTQQYKAGFGITTLKDSRQFYISFSDYVIAHALRG